MGTRIVDLRDLQFVLWEQLELEKHLRHPIFNGCGRDEIDTILREALKFAEEIVYPVNAAGDREGVRLVDGQVRTPPSFKPVYEAAHEAGWSLMSIPEEWGGQGLPHIFEICVGEMTVAASIGFAMCMSSTGGFMVLDQCASEELKRKYIPVIVKPDCTTTMCLTEPEVGSALADIRTIARQRPDGLWELQGTKRFVTKGDSDLVGNIVHLVLARTENAPPGLKGLSLFVVPKYRLLPDGSPGDFNHVTCVKVEEKLGLHASATCEMVFGDGGPCIGELVGERNRGLAGMFVLMNEARILTGLQGEALASAAYLHALEYAKQRVQGVAVENMGDPSAPRVEVIKHPDVRRMLLGMKAMVEGMRALIYKGQMVVTLIAMSEDEQEKQQHEDLLGLLTPVIKAYCADQGFLVTRDAIQVHGAYGFCSDYPVEQHMRDVKIASIWEGTNGIQALDLLGRKVLSARTGMRAYNALLSHMRGFVKTHAAATGFRAHVEKLGAAIELLDSATQHAMQKGLDGDLRYPVMVASEYLEAFGHVVVGQLLAEQLLIAERKLDALCRQHESQDDTARRRLIENSSEAAFYSGKIHAATYFIDKILPRVGALVDSMTSENRDVLDIPECAF